MWGQRKPKELNPLLVKGKSKMILINNNIEWRGKTYDEDYPQMLVDFCTKDRITKRKKNKATWEVETIATDYPTIAAFRVKYKIPKSRWFYRANNYPELTEAIEIVRDFQEDALMKNGLSGRWNAQVVKSVGMADHDWSEKKETVTKQEVLTDEQKQKMFSEYMKWLEQKCMVLEWEQVEKLEDQTEE